MRHSHILFIDDNASLAAVYQLSLGAHGFDVMAAFNGDEAIELFEREDRECVAIVDLNMPGMNGVEVITALQERQPLLKTIAVSGQRMGEHFRRLSDLGVRHFLSKPFSIEDLLHDIQELQEVA